MNLVIRKLHEARTAGKDLPEFRRGRHRQVNVAPARRRRRKGQGNVSRLLKRVVISKKGRASSATFTVRRVSFGTGVERIFPLHSRRSLRLK